MVSGNYEVDYGGFCCVYNVLARIDDLRRGNGSHSSEKQEHDAVKHENSLKAAGISAGEAKVEATFVPQNTVPRIFSKTSLASPKAWRNLKNNSGLAVDILKLLEQVKKHQLTSIKDLYRGLPEIELIAKDVLSAAENFVRVLVRWIDETFSSLVNGGQPADDVWSIILEVVKNIFEDLLAKERGFSKVVFGGSRSSRRASYIWGVLLTHKCTTELSDLEIKNHSIVVGTYSQWLIANSGRKEATDALKEVQALKATLANTESLAKEAGIQAEAAKKLADKVWLQVKK